MTRLCRPKTTFIPPLNVDSRTIPSKCQFRPAFYSSGSIRRLEIPPVAWMAGAIGYEVDWMVDRGFLCNRGSLSGGGYASSIGDVADGYESPRWTSMDKTWLSYQDRRSICSGLTWLNQHCTIAQLLAERRDSSTMTWDVIMTWCCWTEQRTLCHRTIVGRNKC